MFLVARKFLLQFKTSLQVVESLLKLVYTADSRFCAFSLDETIKKRYKFLFFGLRMSISHLALAFSLSSFSTYASLALSKLLRAPITRRMHAKHEAFLTL